MAQSIDELKKLVLSKYEGKRGSKIMWNLFYSSDVEDLAEQLEKQSRGQSTYTFLGITKGEFKCGYEPQSLAFVFEEIDALNDTCEINWFHYSYDNLVSLMLSAKPGFDRFSTEEYLKAREEVLNLIYEYFGVKLTKNKYKTYLLMSEEENIFYNKLHENYLKNSAAHN